MSVGFENAGDAERLGQLEEQVVLVGGVDQDRLRGFGAAHDVNVVVERSDHNLVYLNALIRVNQRSVQVECRTVRHKDIMSPKCVGWSLVLITL